MTSILGSNDTRFRGSVVTDPPPHHSDARLAGTAPPATDLAIVVAAAIAGDRAAVDHVLALVRPLVLRYCRAKIGWRNQSHDCADDVAQDVCLAVLTALPRYVDQGLPFMSFVYGIAAHKVNDVYRAAARNRIEPVADVPDEPTAEAGPEQRAIHGETRSWATELLRLLPARQREILVLRVMMGLSAQ